jgi:hypothetical protein
MKIYRTGKLDECRVPSAAAFIWLCAGITEEHLVFYAFIFFTSFALIQSSIFDIYPHPRFPGFFMVFWWLSLWGSFSMLKKSLSCYNQGENSPAAHFADIFIKLIYGFAIGSSLFDASSIHQ